MANDLIRLRVLLPVALSIFAWAATSYGQVNGIAVSPDGRTIAVSYEKDGNSLIYTIALDTHNATRLTAATAGKESCPAFSPDGGHIAYSYWPGHGNQRIVVTNLDGSNSHVVVESGTANVYATFAPGGGKIYFARSQPPPVSHAWDIFSVDTDGNNLHRITNGVFYQVSQPSFSPDGKSMALMTIGADAHRQIGIYSLEGQQSQRQSLQPHVPKEATHDPLINYPNYMPDGKGILFMAATDGKKGLDYDIYRVDIATGTIRRLTTGNGIASDLRVFADGKTAIFLKWHKNWRGTPDASEIYLLDLQSQKLAPFKINGLNSKTD